MKILALLATLFASMWPVPSATTKTFNITAHAGTTASQFGFTITPSPFVVNQGDTVTLNLSSKDVVHGFILPDYGINVDLIPGQSVTKTFVATTAGTFPYACTQPSCGVGHTNMVGNLIVNAQAPAPAVSSFTPNAGPSTGGTVVTITGTNFQNGATVMFGGAPATNVTVNSATSITATAPSHTAAIVTITVTNPDGQSVNAGTFTFAAPAGHGKRRAVGRHG